MLANTITLSVDAGNTGSPSDVLYNRFDELKDRSVYTGEDHTYTKRDTLGFYRTLPKRAGKSLGVKKSAFKLTRDQEVPGTNSETTNIAPLISDVSFSIPVGTSQVEIIAMVQRMVSLLDSNSLILQLCDELHY